MIVNIVINKIRNWVINFKRKLLLLLLIIIVISQYLRTTKDNLARYSTHSEEGVIKLKTGYPLVPQDHGLISALETLSKHYVRTIIIIIIIITIILQQS